MGEKIIFHRLEQEADGEKLIVENFVTPGHGPLMHTHFLQDEQLTVVKGKLAYQILGQPIAYVSEGQTVLFKRGVPHRFWNAGEDMLTCKGWIKPAHSIVFFLSAIYAAQNKSGKAKPEAFDGAFLMNRYASEYDLPEIPKLVKSTLIPMTYYLGKVLGKYAHFKDAPPAVKP